MKKVAVGILIDNKKVLVCQRKKGARYELKWEFPGGKVEDGESVEQCARRELREELSLEAGPFERDEVEVSHYDDGGSFEVHYCYFATFTGTLKNNVFEQFCWVDAAELARLDILHGNKNIVRRLIDGPLSANHRHTP